MSLLAPCHPWWRYPVKAPKPRALNHTNLRGRNRALYPVRRFTKAECAAYVPEMAREHHKAPRKGERKRWEGSKWDDSCLTTRDPARYLSHDEALTWRQSQHNHPLTGAGERLVLHGFWTFLGADRRCRCWQFTETPKRKATRVRPSFKGEWKRVYNLPPWRGPARLYRIKGKVDGFRPAHFDWKPDRQYCFGAWEQRRFVRWTRTPRPSMADLRHFTAQK